MRRRAGARAHPWPPSDRRGFTLLETMVALALVGLTLVAFLRLVAGSADALVRERAYTVGLALAEGVMEELLDRDPRSLIATDGQAGRFPDPFAGYRYSVRAERVEERRLATVRVRVEWERRAGGFVELASRTPLPPGGAP